MVGEKSILMLRRTVAKSEIFGWWHLKHCKLGWSELLQVENIDGKADPAVFLTLHIKVSHSSAKWMLLASLDGTCLDMALLMFPKGENNIVLHVFIVFLLRHDFDWYWNYGLQTCRQFWSPGQRPTSWSQGECAWGQTGVSHRVGTLRGQSGLFMTCKPPLSWFSPGVLNRWEISSMQWEIFFDLLQWEIVFLQYVRKDIWILSHKRIL